MSNIQTDYDGTITSLTISSLGLSSSATAGWKSATITNSTNKFIDYEVQVKLAAVNTAPSGFNSIIFFLNGSLDGGTTFAGTGADAPDGSEGTLTFPDVTSQGIDCPELGRIKYWVQNTELHGGPWSVADVLGHVPRDFCISALNYSGMTLSPTWVKVRGILRPIA